MALAREWAADVGWPLDSLEVRDPDGRPLAGASVTLGGALVLSTDADGRVRFARTEPGPIDVDGRSIRGCTRSRRSARLLARASS